MIDPFHALENERVDVFTIFISSILCVCLSMFLQQSVAVSWRKLWQLSLTPSLRRLWVLQRDWEISIAKWAAIPKLWRLIKHRQEAVLFKSNSGKKGRL